LQVFVNLPVLYRKTSYEIFCIVNVQELCQANFMMKKCDGKAETSMNVVIITFYHKMMNCPIVVKGIL
jgi:hypothetical protein